MNKISKVILIGGAPMTGKTTIACSIASRFKYACLSTDDLGVVISAVTSYETNKSFHYMNGLNYKQYYIEKSSENLKKDILKQHTALEPAIERLVNIHSTWSTPIVIEGWAIHPKHILKLSSSFTAFFLIASNDLIEYRIKKDTFSEGAADEQLMREKYKARSIWFNEKIKKETKKYNLKRYEVRQGMTSEEITNEIQKNGFLEQT